MVEDFHRLVASPIQQKGRTLSLAITGAVVGALGYLVLTGAVCGEAWVAMIAAASVAAMVEKITRRRGIGQSSRSVLSLSAVAIATGGLGLIGRARNGPNAF